MNMPPRSNAAFRWPIGDTAPCTRLAAQAVMEAADGKLARVSAELQDEGTLLMLRAHAHGNAAITFGAADAADAEAAVTVALDAALDQEDCAVDRFILLVLHNGQVMQVFEQALHARPAKPGSSPIADEKHQAQVRPN